MLEIVFYMGLGLIIGSFLNVLAVRSHDGRSIGGRSQCVSCGHTLLWYDLFPIVSWFVLLGKCRYCGQRISSLYPVTEAVTGVLFLLIGLSSLPWWSTTLALCIAALLVVIARYDLSHMLIPDLWVYVFAALSLGVALYSQEARLIVSNIFAGPIVATPFLLLWTLSRGAWMGLGDAKLAVGIGWLLGLAGGVAAVFGAFVIGAVVGLFLIVLSKMHLYLPEFMQYHPWSRGVKSLTMKSKVPFGPFLVAACLLVWMTQIYGIPLPALL